GGHGAGPAHHGPGLRRDPGRGDAGRDPPEPPRPRGLPRDMTATEIVIEQNAMTPLLQVEAIHTYYGKSNILDGISLEVGSGEVVGLLGRNGVGKSTTLKAIAGLIHPSAGRVVFAGRPITGLPAHRIARLGIAYVPEDRRIFRLLTVT